MALEAPAAALQQSAATEDNFQSLYDKGAFNPDGKTNAEQPSPEVAQPEAPPAPAAAPPPEGEAVAEEEGPEFASIEDYLAKSNVEASSFYDLPVTVKIDGKTSQVKLADVLKSYQLEGHVNQKSIALSEAQRALDTERQQAQQHVASQLQQAQTLGSLARHQLMAEYQNINWNQLRIDNPGEWAVRNTEFNQRANQIDAHLQQVAMAQQQQTQEQQQQLAKVLPLEREKMFNAHPEWRDDKQFQTARTQMGEYARKLGFSDAELNGIYDHRYMQALHDAAQYARLQASSPQAVKRVRTAPVAAQPGARTSRDPKQVAQQQAKEAFQKSPRDVDRQAAYFSTLT